MGEHGDSLTPRAARCFLTDTVLFSRIRHIFLLNVLRRAMYATLVFLEDLVFDFFHFKMQLAICKCIKTWKFDIFLKKMLPHHATDAELWRGNIFI